MMPPLIRTPEGVALHPQTYLPMTRQDQAEYARDVEQLKLRALLKELELREATACKVLP